MTRENKTFDKIKYSGKKMIILKIMMMNFLMKPYKKLQQRKVWLHLLDLFQILKRYHKHFVIFLDDKNSSIFIINKMDYEKNRENNECRNRACPR